MNRHGRILALIARRDRQRLDDHDHGDGSDPASREAVASRAKRSHTRMVEALIRKRRSSPGLAAAAGVVLRPESDAKGEGVLATRSFARDDTVMVGFLVGPLTANDSHATQVGPQQWARHGGLGPKVNHSCDPNCGVRLNETHAFDFIARRPIVAGQELTFDYAMRNFTIDHFPKDCLCGTTRCRGAITGWKDLPTQRKADYGDLVAPYLRVMDKEALGSGRLNGGVSESRSLRSGDPAGERL